MEARATELKGQGKPLSEISEILSHEAQHVIGKSAVCRFFEANATAAAQAIENSNKLAAKVAETEINTIEARLKVVDNLLELAAKSMDERNRILACKTATETLDSLDKRLGNISPPGAPVTNLNNNIDRDSVKGLSDAELIRIIEHEQ